MNLKFKLMVKPHVLNIASRHLSPCWNQPWGNRCEFRAGRYSSQTHTPSTTAFKAEGQTCSVNPNSLLGPTSWGLIPLTSPVPRISSLRTLPGPNSWDLWMTLLGNKVLADVTMTIPRTSAPPTRPSPTLPQQLAKFFSRRAGGEVWMASIQFLNWKPHAYFLLETFLCVNTVCSVTILKLSRTDISKVQA